MTLARGLTDREAKDVSAELNRRGIAVTQSADGDADRYALTIAESALPTAWQARAAQGRQLESPRAASKLLATRDAELREREDILENRLNSAIQKLPNVRSVSVLLTLARPDNKLGDLLQPPATSAPRAVVSLVCERQGACPGSEQLQPLLSAAVPGLRASDVRVLSQREPAAEVACAELGHIGPLTVTRASLPTLKLWLATSLVLHMLGSLGLLFLFQRKRRQAPDAAKPSDPK